MSHWCCSRCWKCTTHASRVCEGCAERKRPTSSSLVSLYSSVLLDKNEMGSTERRQGLSSLCGRHKISGKTVKRQKDVLAKKKTKRVVPQESKEMNIPSSLSE